jgi:hypothetical protein
MVGNSCGSSQESKISTSYEPYRARARVWYCTQGAAGTSNADPMSLSAGLLWGSHGFMGHVSSSPSPRKSDRTSVGRRVTRTVSRVKGGSGGVNTTSKLERS